MKWINRLDKYVVALLIISVAVAFLIHFPELISLADKELNDQTLFPDLEFNEVMSEVLFAAVSLIGLFLLNITIFRFDRPSSRIGWAKLGLSFLFTWLASMAFSKLFIFLHHHLGLPVIHSTAHHYLHPLRDIIVASIVTGICFISYLIRKSQQVVLENEQLRTENLLTQYEALKSQLNPHMLFNSLNTLRSLIRETPDKAQNYLQELSYVLRYTLQENDQKQVTLEEEMHFVRAYIYLLKMRYEENLNFDISLPDGVERAQVPPMSVQLLIENAVKHNEISKRRPFTIRIHATETALTVSNRLQPKLTSTAGTRIGLSNLAKRYQLLFKKEIVVTQGDSLFQVQIPLI